MTLRIVQFFLPLACLALTTGCVSTQPDSDPVSFPSTLNSTSALGESDELSAQEPTQYGNFTRDELTQAILSELGAQRGHFAEATESYYALARQTQDPGVIRRALQFAMLSGDSPRVVELGELWSGLYPSDIEPQLLLGYQYLESAQFEEALEHLTRVLELSGRVDFTAVTARTEDLPAAQRQTIQRRLIALRAAHPEELSLHYAIIQLLDQDGQTDTALSELEKVKRQFGDSAQIALIQAQLLQNLGRQERADTVLRQAIERFPDNQMLRFSYAQLLVRGSNLEAAREQYESLVRQSPDEYELIFTLGVLNLEMEELEEARVQFSRLLDVGYRSNESRFYMGYISESQEQLNAAIGHYRQVQMTSNNYLNAQRQVIRLLVAQERYEEAHQWGRQLTSAQPRLGNLMVNIEAEALIGANQLPRAQTLLNNALQRSPDNVDLLFARTLLNERKGDLRSAEDDLRRIIQIDPNDARALNHLGYTLADRTDRHAEALQLIQRAIAISPDDPAIIDSLGWAQYKLGHYEEALVNLRRAYAAFPDPEVASHLGEVLWVMGREREARKVWNESLKENPDNELIQEAVERLTGSRAQPERKS